MRKRKYNEQVVLEFVYTKAFKSLWDAYGLTQEDRKRFEEEVIKYEKQNTNPNNTLGNLIQGTGGAFKYRLDSPDENIGKSSGYRIIYCKYGRRVYGMLLIYKKSDKETLTQKEKSMIKDSIKNLKEKH